MELDQWIQLESSQVQYDGDELYLRNCYWLHTWIVENTTLSYHDIERNIELPEDTLKKLLKMCKFALAQIDVFEETVKKLHHCFWGKVCVDSDFKKSIKLVHDWINRIFEKKIPCTVRYIFVG